MERNDIEAFRQAADYLLAQPAIFDRLEIDFLKCVIDATLTGNHKIAAKDIIPSLEGKGHTIPSTNNAITRIASKTWPKVEEFYRGPGRNLSIHILKPTSGGFAPVFFKRQELETDAQQTKPNFTQFETLLKEEVAPIKAEMESLRSWKEDEIQTLEQAIFDKQAEMESLKELKQSEIESLKEEVAATRAEVQSLRARNEAKIESLKHQVSEKRAEIEALKERNETETESLKRDIAAKDGNIVSLSHRIHVQEARVHVLQKQRNRIVIAAILVILICLSMFFAYIRMASPSRALVIVEPRQNGIVGQYQRVCVTGETGENDYVIIQDGVTTHVSGRLPGPNGDGRRCVDRVQFGEQNSSGVTYTISVISSGKSVQTGPLLDSKEVRETAKMPVTVQRN